MITAVAWTREVEGWWPLTVLNPSTNLTTSKNTWHLEIHKGTNGGRILAEFWYLKRALLTEFWYLKRALLTNILNITYLRGVAHSSWKKSVNPLSTRSVSTSCIGARCANKTKQKPGRFSYEFSQGYKWSNVWIPFRITVQHESSDPSSGDQWLVLWTTARSSELNQ